MSYLWLTSAESYIFGYCMMYKWSILFHMPIMCSIEIYIRMSTTSVSQYHVHIGCDQYQPQYYRVFKSLPKSAKGREVKRIGTLAREDGEFIVYVFLVGELGAPTTLYVNGIYNITTGTWFTDFGQEMTYYRWGDAEPDDPPSKIYIRLLNNGSDSYEFKTTHGNKDRPFICESIWFEQNLKSLLITLC